MELTVKTGAYGKMFGVPCDVVDHYIKLADENQIKVLLYFLRHSGDETDTDTAASFLNLSEKEVEDAVVFWQKANLFMSTSSKTLVKVKIKQDDKQIKPSAKQAMDRDVYSSMLDSSAELKTVYSIAEKSLKRPLTYNERQQLKYIQQDISLDITVTVTLIKYLESTNKLNIEYLKSKAEEWKRKDIDSIEKANVEIKEEAETNSYYKSIQRLFNLKFPLVEDQRRYADEWRKKNYSVKMLQEAYSKTISNINTVNFKYIDKVLLGLSGGEDSRTGKDIYESDDLNKYNEMINNF